MGDWTTVTTMIGPHGQLTTTASPPRQGDRLLVGAAGLATELRGLSELFQAGRLTQDEYETCKRAVISRQQSSSVPPAAAPAVENGLSAPVTEDVRAEVECPAEPAALEAGPPGALTPPVNPDARVWANEDPVPQQVEYVPVNYEPALPPSQPPVQDLPNPGDPVDLDELHRLKMEAVAAEDFARAKYLKELIDVEEERRRRVPPEELKALLEQGLWYPEVGGALVEAAEHLLEQEPEALYDILGARTGFSRGTCARNWRSIIEVFAGLSQHAAQQLGAIQETDPGDPQNEVGAADGGEEVVEDLDQWSQIRGVIDFLDAPLSPGTLRDVRLIRKGMSPRRGQSPPQ